MAKVLSWHIQVVVVMIHMIMTIIVLGGVVSWYDSARVTMITNTVSKVLAFPSYCPGHHTNNLLYSNLADNKT